jgi:high-affinity K+ transport system ATPase subunit B
MLVRAESLMAARVCLRAAEAALRHGLADYAVAEAQGLCGVVHILDRVTSGIAEASAELADLRAALLEEMGRGDDHE